MVLNDVARDSVVSRFVQAANSVNSGVELYTQVNNGVRPIRPFMAALNPHLPFLMFFADVDEDMV